MVDPTGHAAVGMRDFVESNGGTVSWDESTRTATATLNGHTETFNINEQTVQNGRIIGDDQNLARAFGVNLSSSSLGTANEGYSGIESGSESIGLDSGDAAILGSQWHTDYNLKGEKFIHYQGYRFNEKGELVEHSGKVIQSQVTGAAAKALQYLKNVKPNFFRGGPIFVIPEGPDLYRIMGLPPPA